MNVMTDDQKELAWFRENISNRGCLKCGTSFAVRRPSDQELCINCIARGAYSEEKWRDDLLFQLASIAEHLKPVGEFFAEELKHTREFHEHMNTRGIPETVPQKEPKCCGVCRSTLHDDNYHTVVQKAKQK